MPDWLRDALALHERGEPFVLVTIAGTRGSSPRETGARMIVTRSATLGTIGGGRLEYECARLACEWLRSPEPTSMRARLHRFPLGSSFGQCCGGIVEVLFEELSGQDQPWLVPLAGRRDAEEPAILVSPLDEPQRKLLVDRDAVLCSVDDTTADRALVRRCREILAGGAGAEIWSARDGDRFLLEPLRDTDFVIAVFGAGHVGTALVRFLAELPCRIQWIDSRPELLEQSVAGNVVAQATAAPESCVAHLPPGAFCVVMTHSHPLDLEICARILAKGDAAYCGLIGSLSKRRRFEKRFRQLGLDEAAISRLTCPIGIAGIDGKRPAEIALAVAAEILVEYEKWRTAIPVGELASGAGSP